jgi:DNA-binding NarL/FixJ family response regulator
MAREASLIARPPLAAKQLAGEAPPLRVVLTDDHPVVRSGIRALLEQAPDITVVGEADNGTDALRLVAALQPDVLLLDVQMPGLDGVEVARQLKASGSPTFVLALSAYDDEHFIRELLACGAAGYLTKDEAPDAIVEAVRGVARGEEGWFSRRAAARLAAWSRSDNAGQPRLTEREADVLRLLSRGWSNNQIAEELFVTERTVRFHLRNIYDKIEVNSRGEAIAWALREGNVTPALGD